MFSDYLSAARKTLGLSRKELADAIGVKKVTSWELGYCLPDSWAMRQIVDYLQSNGMDCTELIASYRTQKGRRHYRKLSGKIWDDNFEALCSYLGEHHEYPPASSELGIWVSYQRINRSRETKTTIEHIKRLNSIHFQWDADTDKEMLEWKKAIWKDNYDIVYESFMKTGCMSNSRWVRMQLTTSHTAEEQELLNKIGIRMVSGDIIRERRKSIPIRELADALGISMVTLRHWEKKQMPEYFIWYIPKVIEKIKGNQLTREVFFSRCGMHYTGIGNGRTIIVPGGTRIYPKTTQYFRQLSVSIQRDKMIEQGEIVYHILQNDYEFSSPLIAASILSGRGIFTSEVWHDRDGHTWKEIWGTDNRQ